MDHFVPMLPWGQPCGGALGNGPCSLRDTWSQLVGRPCQCETLPPGIRLSGAKFTELSNSWHCYTFIIPSVILGFRIATNVIHGL